MCSPLIWQQTSLLQENRFPSTELEGDKLDEEENPKKEVIELWRRNPVECVKELMGNPAFRDVMRYAPERVYDDEDGKSRVYNEMWPGDWWWNLQVSAYL